ncbi:DUF2142 domain-containing protein [Leptolyngbyaceae cyanobacterium UHCC 1019]
MKVGSKLRLIAPEKIFAILVSIFGILFLIVTPPFQVADENAHFFRAYHVSEGHLMAKRADKEFGGLLPESLSTVAQVVSAGVAFHPENKQKIEDIFTTLRIPLNVEKRSFINYWTVAKYSPVPYLPQASGIAIARLFGATPLALMYFGRLFNLIFFALTGYFAIKITPIFKWGFLLLLLTPISLFTAASVSGDALTIGVSFLLTAVFLSCALDENVSFDRPKGIIIFVLAALLSLAKPPYQLLILLFFTIPIKKIGNRKTYFAVFTLLAAWCAALSLGVVYAIKDLKDVSYSPEMTSPTSQLAFLADNPGMFFVAFFNGWKVDGLSIIHQLIGQLGWLDTKLPGVLIDSYLGILVIIALFGGNKKIRLFRIQRFVIFLTAALNIILISFVLYLHWAPLGASVIRGWQGRYLIPFSPLLFLLFYNRKFSVEDEKLELLVTCYVPFAATLTLIVLFYRYYI